jgi:hypothetical protein
MTRLHLTGDQWEGLRSHLFAGEVEHAAFLYASRSELVVTDVELMTGGDVVSGLRLHITLSDDVRPRVIKRAWDADATLIEVHSHRLHGPASFSPTDLAGLGDFAPHILWRLPDRPYMPLVFAEASFDALVWHARHEPPCPLDALVIAGDVERPTGVTIDRMEERSNGI